MKLSINGKLLTVVAETVAESRKLYDFVTEVPKQPAEKNIVRRKRRKMWQKLDEESAKAAFDYGLKTDCSAAQLHKHFGIGDYHANRIRGKVIKERDAIKKAADPFTTDFLAAA